MSYSISPTLPPSSRTEAAPPPGVSSKRVTVLPSLRKNVAWIFSSNVVFAGSQWAVLVVLARLGTPETVGTFALALAIASPVFMLASLDLRWIQATDSGRRYDFRDCLALRLLSCAVAFLVMIAICYATGYAASTILIITAIGGVKSIDAISDVVYGWFQQHERMELMAQSLMLRGPLSIGTVALVFGLTRDLYWTCLGLAATWLIVLVTHDLPRAEQFRREMTATPSLWPRWDASRLAAITWKALPVGVTAGILSLCANVPRYFIERSWGAHDLGIFAAMAYLLLAGHTFVKAVNQSATPRLATYLLTRNIGGFRILFWKLVGLGAACGVAGVLFAVVAGRLFLECVYGAEYAQHPHVLTWLLLSTGVMFVFRPCEVALRVNQRFWLLLAIYVVTLPLFIGAAAAIIPRWGMTGAAVTMLAHATLHGCLTLVANQYALRLTLSRGAGKGPPAAAHASSTGPTGCRSGPPASSHSPLHLSHTTSRL